MDDGVRVDWFDADHSAICLTFQGHWTVDDYLAAVDTATAMAETEIADGHTLLPLVVDARAGMSFPARFIPMAGNTLQYAPDVWNRQFILIGVNALRRQIVETIVRIYGRGRPTVQLNFVENPADARALLAALKQDGQSGGVQTDGTK